MVELSSFRDIPHLMTPVVTDMKKATAVLEWACKKMDRRYSLLANVGARNISAYNALGEDGIRAALRSPWTRPGRANSGPQRSVPDPINALCARNSID